MQTEQSTTTSRRVQSLLPTVQHVVQFFIASTYARRAGQPGICDFVGGNPQEMPLPGIGQALQRWSEPHRGDWFGYQMNDPLARQTVADSLTRRLGAPYDPRDVSLTTGAFAGLAASLQAVVDPGDEVIFISPPWFFYELLIASSGAVPVRVGISDTFDLDLAAIQAAITPKTRALIVNSPNNPTGKIYPEETLAALGALLREASARHGRPIYVLSDEAYSRIVYDERPCPSAVQLYPHTLLIYTYGKTLLTPGERIGYVALSPLLPEAEREPLRLALLLAQVATGYAFPNAVLQKALPELDALSVDIGHLQRKRDRLVSELRSFGYDVHIPEATFYLLPRAPIQDDLAFTELLAKHDVFVLPGSLVEMPGYFRMSLTATDDMIDKALGPLRECADRAGG